jgi:phosphatidylserine/phosphatidylglycerophosphate/cardiolipin synthase-like enzyme
VVRLALSYLALGALVGMGLGGALATWRAKVERPFAETHFAPGPACRLAAVQVIDGARRTVRVSAYGLSSPAVKAALVRAHGRGVDVRALVDRTNREHGAPELAGEGVVVLVDAAHPVNHAKIVEADGEVVWFGSANLTPSSERDHEVCRVEHDPAFAAEVERDWGAHAAHAERIAR